jgi:hypothetical protein
LRRLAELVAAERIGDPETTSADDLGPPVALAPLAHALATGQVRAWAYDPGVRVLTAIRSEDLFTENWSAWESLVHGRIISDNGPLARLLGGQRLLVSLHDLKDWLLRERRWEYTPKTAADRHPAPTEPPASTGAPGRPSSMHLVLQEFERRRKSGVTEVSRQKEAYALEAWLKGNHPNAPTLTAKTIRNKLPSNFQPFHKEMPETPA